MFYGCVVYTERAETVAVLCSTSHASAVSTQLQWIFKNNNNNNNNNNKTRYKKLVTHVESHASAVSLLDSGEQRCIKRSTTTTATV